MFMRGETGTGTAPRPGGGVTLPTMGHTMGVFVLVLFGTSIVYHRGEDILQV